MSSRRRLVACNLSCAFPSFDRFEVSLLTFTTIRRTIEQGLLGFAWPFLSKHRIHKLFSIDPKSTDLLLRASQSPNGTLWLIPHFCHADALSFLPEKLSGANEIFALYRPLKNPVFDNFVRTSRKRFGVHTIDRKDGGMLKTLKVLKSGETLAMLFDQNAGAAGTRLPFMGRECSCTTLPDILNEKYQPCILFVYTKRISFWASSIEADAVRVLGFIVKV